MLTWYGSSGCFSMDITRVQAERIGAAEKEFIQEERDTDTGPGPGERPVLSREERRKTEWVKKCVSSFSLYTEIVGNQVEDPYEQVAVIDPNDIKKQLARAARRRPKKRLKRHKKETYVSKLCDGCKGLRLR